MTEYVISNYEGFIFRKVGDVFYDDINFDTWTADEVGEYLPMSEDDYKFVLQLNIQVASLEEFSDEDEEEAERIVKSYMNKFENEEGGN